MPCLQCQNGKWKFGETGQCIWDSQDECERHNTESTDKDKPDDELQSCGPTMLPEANVNEILAIRPEALPGIKASIQAGIVKPMTRRVSPVSIVPGTSIGLLKTHGSIIKRDTFLSFFMGETAHEQIQDQFRAIANEDAISEILWAIDSPGGVVAMTEDTARLMFHQLHVL